MDPISVGIAGSIVAFVLIFLGMPIALALMLTGFLGIWQLASPGAAYPVAARVIYAVSSQYAYTVSPLFLLMGAFAGNSGLVENLYRSFATKMKNIFKSTF